MKKKAKAEIEHEETDSETREKNIKGPKNLLCLSFHIAYNEQVTHFSLHQTVTISDVDVDWPEIGKF